MLVASGTTLIATGPPGGASAYSGHRDPTRAVIDGDADEYVTNGEHLDFTDLVVTSATPDQLSFRLSPDFGEYAVDSTRPLASTSRSVRTTMRNAWSGRRPAVPASISTGEDSGCTHQAGRFIIDELTVDTTGTVASFAARFEQH